MNAMTTIHPEDRIRELMLEQARKDRAAMRLRCVPPIQPVKVPKAAPRRGYEPPKPVLPRMRITPKPQPAYEQKGGVKAGPVTIRGVEYETPAAAAKAPGVARQTIYGARSLGRLDLVGIGRGGGQVGKHVTINGVKHRSHYAAGRSLGVSHHTAARMAKTEDFVVRTAKTAATRAQVAEMRAAGVKVPEIAKAVGVSVSCVYDHIRALAKEATA